MTPAVSVLLPFFNAGSRLEDAVRSIVAQTFSDWELLLINNNSTDESLAIATHWSLANSRIRLVHEPQQGIAYALNTGLARACGAYIARMDADDVCEPERLALQLKYLHSHPEVDVVSCCSRFDSSLEQSSGYARFVNWQNSILTPEAHAANRFIESPVAHPSVMFRRELVERLGHYSTEPVPEDYELWLRWMEHGVRFAKLPEVLLQWNDSPGRLSRQHAHYSDEAFYRVKCRYLARYILQHIHPGKKVVVCGGGRLSRQRAALLGQEGVPVWGFTDVRRRYLPDLRFLALDELQDPEPWLLVNFISQPGVNSRIRDYLVQLNYRELVDFILAA